MKAGMYLVKKGFGNITKDQYLRVEKFVNANNGAVNALYHREFDDNGEQVLGRFPAEYLVSEEEFIFFSDRLHRAQRDFNWLMSVTE